MCMGIGLAASLMTLALSHFGLFEDFELATLDWRFRLRGGISPSDRITIVGVEGVYRKSLARKDYAALIKQYRGSTVIGFDLVLDRPNEDEDIYLATASTIADVYYSFGKRHTRAEPDYRSEERIKALGKFDWEVAAKCRGNLEKLEKDEIVAPLPEFSTRAKGIGHVYAGKDAGKVIRRIPLLIECEGKFYPLLSLQMACELLQVEKANVHLGEYIELDRKAEKDIKIPIDKNGYMFINYVGEFKRFRKFYFLSEIFSKRPQLSDTILIGAIAKESDDPREEVDYHITPFGKYPGVGIHANVLDNILREDFLHRMGKSANASTSIIMGMLVGGIAFQTYRKKREGGGIRRIRVVTGILLIAILFGIYLGFALLLFKALNVWVNLAGPLMLLLLAAAAYLIIATCQIDMKVAPSFGFISGRKALRYCLASAIIAGSFITVIAVGKKVVILLFAAVFLLIGLRVAGLISAKKFEEHIDKIFGKMISAPKDKESDGRQDGNSKT